MIESISVYDIDIRSIEKYNDNHIPGAKNISYESLLLRPNQYLNIYNKYYIYCQRGKLSRTLCQTLKLKGYNVVNITGGYEAWILSR